MDTQNAQVAEQLAALTGDGHREMLAMKDDGRLPTIIGRSLDLFFSGFFWHFQRGFELLEDFVNAVFVALGQPRIVKLGLRNTEHAPLFHGSRHTRLDISSTDEYWRIPVTG